ncbi:hypothetical protein OIU84_008867 [Salix udensis]|uniref:Cytochrome P450 n=1 Tax=Salix udensis TaxID=889485 RepID=A0AAD6NY06_9ROSI|nr:hypothetical protein OIU84_008867 [Salix udensis]
MSAEILTLANNSSCRMIMSARCSGEDNQAEKCRALVSESFDLAAKLALCNVIEHEEKAKREGPTMEKKDLMDILLEVYHDENAEIRITRKQMKNFFLDLFIAGTSSTADAILVTAMVQCFDWKVIGGDGPDGSKVNMDTKSGVVKSMAKPFMAIPVLHRNLFSA